MIAYKWVFKGRRPLMGFGAKPQFFLYVSPYAITSRQTGSDHVIPSEANYSAFSIALLRHPPVRDVQGICYGRTEALLAPGWQASGYITELTEAVASTRPVIVWTSPSRRCRIVAEVLASRLGVAVSPDDRLRELDFGDWEGLPWDEVPRRELDRWAQDPTGFAPPGGESGAALIARVREVASMLQNQAQPCVVLSHGGPLRLLPSLLQDKPADLLAPTPAPGRLSIVTAHSRMR